METTRTRVGADAKTPAVRVAVRLLLPLPAAASDVLTRLPAHGKRKGFGADLTFTWTAQGALAVGPVVSQQPSVGEGERVDQERVWARERQVAARGAAAAAHRERVVRLVLYGEA